MVWNGVRPLTSQTYTCGHCGNLVASSLGYQHEQHDHHRIYICPHCDEPSHITPDRQIPGVAPGDEVKALPKEVEALYREARNSVAASAHTGSVLLSRKLLMNVAVAQGAELGQSFLQYVEYLAVNGYVPPKGKGWVDHIRKKGNEAAHEIVPISKADAEELISFAEMLLKFIYEFPSRVPKAGS